MNVMFAFQKTRYYRYEWLIIMLCILLMEGIFSWIFIRNSIMIEGYTKAMGILIYAFMLFKYPALKTLEKVYMVLFTAIMIKLVIQSLFLYNTWFEQLTMFHVLFPVVYVIFVKYLMHNFEIDLLPFIAKFYLITYVVFMVLFGRGFSFSLEMVEMSDYGPFSGDSRIIHASHILMIIVPLLWHLHEYIVFNKKKHLILLLLCVAIILLHQHRSVWSSTFVALFFYLVGVTRNGYLRASKINQLLFGSLGLILLFYFFVSNLVPGFVDFLGERFGEILNPAKEGSTGNFRLEQRETYFNLFLQRPFFGWTFEGFEMPNPLVDWWPPMTGQHFHEGYMEMLFYHGLVGLMLKYGILVYLAVKSFSKNLPANAIILLAFCISGLVFSLNYVLPLVFWAMVGLCLYYLHPGGNKKNTNSDNGLHLHMDLR